MNSKESASVEQLTKSVLQLIEENKAFRAEIHARVEKAEARVEREHRPFDLQQDILTTAQKAINEAIQKSLTGYSSPLVKLVESVVNEHSDFLRGVISDSFSSVIRLEEFKSAIIAGFSHKIARSIISNQDGLFDKVSKEMKQDPVFKSKITLAVASVVEECLKK